MLQKSAEEEPQVRFCALLVERGTAKAGTLQTVEIVHAGRGREPARRS